MNAAELRAKSVPELKEELETLLRDQFRSRMEYGSGQLAQTHKLRSLRRDIARVRTIIGEKRRADETA